ncbi:hypothetical protein SNE40_012545 [Patella caerulea]|uniref:Uncharacterized protein n=1 Tax=Patella caerulea TaxID=87958 RepID=A0AAN8JLX7_PATCE
MALRKSKIYKLIINGNREALVKGMMEYLRSGKSPNIRDPETGGNLLHHIVDNADRFMDPETLTLVYMLACKDVEIDAQDNDGNTSLHKTVKVKGAHRLLIALIRCGIDTGIRNDESLTAEDILLHQKPDGWQTMLHYYNKYKPGLWQALQAEVPDRKLVERLLKSWCRVTSVKNGKVTSFKTLLQSDIKKTDLIQLLESYENTVELALALVGGVGMIVRMWLKQGILNNYDPSTEDIVYQQRYPDTVTVPQPILAATWETNSLTAIDVIMELKTDPNVLYSPNPPVIPPKPLYFNILDSEFRPTNPKIIERIFKDSDFSRRNSEGQTILYELIGRNEPESLIKFVLNKGINLASRDRLGRTAWDFAEEHGRTKHCQLINDQIIRLIKTKKISDVEKLILDSYSHLHDIKDNSGRSVVEIAKKSSTRQMCDIVKLADDIQTYVRRLFQAIEEGIIDDLKKLLSCGKYAAAKDKAGRTPLLRAILRHEKDMVLYLVEEHDFVVNETDNLGRSPLHYAYLFLDDPEVIDVLEKHGADPDLKDVRGLKSGDYNSNVLSSQVYLNLVKEVEDIDLDIYIHETKFDSQFKTAIQAGDFDVVQNLITEIKQHGDPSRYSNVLFDCIDNDKEDIAVFLLMSGFKMDVYKQYDRCDPNDPMCAMMECGHGMTSLLERARQLKFKRVVQVIEDFKKEQTSRASTSR